MSDCFHKPATHEKSDHVLLQSIGLMPEKSVTHSIFFTLLAQILYAQDGRFSFALLTLSENVEWKFCFMKFILTSLFFFLHPFKDWIG